MGMYLFQKGKYMTKKFGLSVAAAALLATSIQAAEVSAPHNNLTLWGGVSASLTSQSENIQGNTKTADNDYFCLDTAVIGATVKVDDNNPFGGTVVAGNFAVKTVTGAKVVLGDPVTESKSNFRVWLGHIDYTPVSNVMVNAGLLWQNFGEKPVDALNAHMTRTTDFVFQPVAMAGLRVSYDAGMAKVYAGLNDGSVLGGSHTATTVDVANADPAQKGLINTIATSFDNQGGTGSQDSETVDAATSGMEAGVHVGLDQADIGLNYFAHNGDGMSTLNASATEKLTGFDVGFEYNTHHSTVMASGYTADALLGTALATSAGAAAYDLDVNSMQLKANIKLAENISMPVRYEMTTIALGESQSGLKVPGDLDELDVNSLTITPTYNPTASSFIRAEIVSTSSKDEIFVSGKNDKPEKTRSTVALEFGLLF